MYENVGKTIQAVGCILGWLLSIAGLGVFFWLLANDYSSDDALSWWGLGIGLIGFFSTFFSYAFGQLVDDVHTIRCDSEITNKS